MNRTAHHTSTNADQRWHTAAPVPLVTEADYRARLHALVAAFVACGQELRALHERYKDLQGAEPSREWRDSLQQFFHAELDVLRESQRLHEQIDEVLRSLREIRLRART